MTDTTMTADPPALASAPFTGATLFEPEAAAGDSPAEVTGKAKKPVVEFTLINPNQRWFVIFLLFLFGAILMASIVWSFNAIVEMSSWMAPNDHLRWLPAVFLDMAIIGYSLTLAVFRFRESKRLLERAKAGLPPLTTASGRPKNKIWMTRTGLMVSTGFSVIANATHTLDYWDGDLSTYQSWIGIGLSAAIPVLAFWATEEIIRIAFAGPESDDLTETK
ncbi:hypothetical protein [Frigoribacterium sp. SL97]|uniref:hypothetical protein n=1 Tax=Frigoribacterium sp. SL97 TaxID=2994664 RepID=UPI00226D4E82|nr:hypothetical protein [Frigoribacterium sp. SL97]WAC50433.1 hypothetical protein OVA02_11180 [Frigoribacterium sp. SL97]